MSADVDICNLALSYLGDEATVASINPPEGSAQAGHCARFYPMARDELLEMHTWGFATTRIALAAVANPSSTWQYAYAGPSDAVNYLEILDPAATDEYTVGVQMTNTIYGAPNTGLSSYVPQPFEVEEDANGSDIILTNQQDAVLRYTRTFVDAAKYSPLFTEALARLLASKLAGPVLKGSEGRNESKAQLELFRLVYEKAVESDANQRRLRITQGAPWMTGR